MRPAGSRSITPNRSRRRRSGRASRRCCTSGAGASRAAARRREPQCSSSSARSHDGRLQEVLDRPDDLEPRQLVHAMGGAAPRLRADALGRQPRHRNRGDLPPLPSLRPPHRRLDGSSRPQEGDGRARLAQRARDPLDPARRAVRAPDRRADLRRHVHPVDDLHCVQRGRVRRRPEPRLDRRPRHRERPHPGDVLRGPGRRAAARRRASVGPAADLGDGRRLRLVRSLGAFAGADPRQLQRAARRGEGTDDDPARRSRRLALRPLPSRAAEHLR